MCLQSIKHCIHSFASFILGYSSIPQQGQPLQQQKEDDDHSSTELTVTTTTDTAAAPTTQQQRHLFQQYMMRGMMLRHQKHDENMALETFRKAVTILPHEQMIQEKDAQQAYVQIGIILASRNEWKEALEAFLVANKIEPEHWMILSKLIQCYHALGEISERDRVTSHMYQLHQEAAFMTFLPNVPVPIPVTQFCREQINTSKGSIGVWECFQFSYKFFVYKWKMKWTDKVPPTSPTSITMITVGSYDMTNNLMMGMKARKGKSGGLERVYHIDGYNDNRSIHRTVKTWESATEPTYDEVRERMLAAMMASRP